MVDGIILAGGKSTRMKTNKMLLTINEHPIIWHTLKSIEPFVSKVIIVTGLYDKEIREALKGENVIFIHNLDYEKGMFSSVQKGIKETSNDFFIIPGDCPFVKPDTFKALLAGKGEVRVPRYLKEDGHPIYISKKYKNEILSMPLDSNLKIFRDSKNYEIINVEDKNIVINLNEFLDYQNIKITEEGR